MNFTDLIYLKIIPSGLLLALKIISAIVSLLMIAGITFFLKKTSWLTMRYTQDLKDFLSFKPIDVKKFEKILTKIQNRLQSQSMDEHKLALIESDNLLGEILGKMGYKGRDISEQLEKISEDILPNVWKVREARKIIGNIISDPDYLISADKAKGIMKVYEVAFQELGVI